MPNCPGNQLWDKNKTAAHSRCTTLMLLSRLFFPAQELLFHFPDRSIGPSSPPISDYLQPLRAPRGRGGTGKDGTCDFTLLECSNYLGGHQLANRVMVYAECQRGLAVIKRGRSKSSARAGELRTPWMMPCSHLISVWSHRPALGPSQPSR